MATASFCRAGTDARGRQQKQLRYAISIGCDHTDLLVDEIAQAQADEQPRPVSSPKLHPTMSPADATGSHRAEDGSGPES